MVNPSKETFLSIDERLMLIKESIKHLKNVEVDNFEGLAVDYAYTPFGVFNDVHRISLNFAY